MKLITLLAVCAWLLLTTAAFGLPAHRDAFFIENDLVYRRFLALTSDGTYRQIDQDRMSCAEVDQGSWDVAPDGTVQLHSNHHALRFRALMAGPLSVVLDSQEKLDALPRMAAAIRRFLDSTHDQVFAAGNATEFGAMAGAGVETFSRDEAQTFLRQVEDTVESERTGIYRLRPVKLFNGASLLVLQDAVFRESDLARVSRDYPVKGKEPPPFYFAQVDERTFAREVGTWQTFRFLGEPD